MTAPDQDLSRPIAWLVGTKATPPASVAAQLQAGLFTSMPIFLGGIINSIAIAAIAAARHPTTPFLIWLSLEVAIGLIRLPIVLGGRAALRNGRKPPVTAAALCSCAWAASVGFGAFISIRTEDWVLATIICLSAAAMVCGICLRNFGTPRLAALMVSLMLVPCAVAALLTSEAVIAIVGLQLPIYMITIFASSFALHEMMASRMKALAELQRSEGLNQSIMEASPDYTLILDEQGRIVFMNSPRGSTGEPENLYGMEWLPLLHPDDRDEAARVLASARSGTPASLTARSIVEGQPVRWFDVIASPIMGSAGQTMIVGRDITHQKASEARAVWVARHDPLTGLANRSVLQDELERRLLGAAHGDGSALLIVDVDNFKTINDTLGHDAGDALLCTFAERLRKAAGPNDLVTRTGGDEFALLIAARNLSDVTDAAERIYANLREPFVHENRLLECSASIGASMLLKDGVNRSEVMKSADIALYAAKAGGRGQLKVFDLGMKTQVERQQTMLASARKALQQDRIVPFYQPKVQLGTGRIVGFEALLRWTDDYEALRTPDDLSAAFDDPPLAAALSERMIDLVLDQMQEWGASGIDFGHVAINVTAGDFRRREFAEHLLEKLAQRRLSPSLLQLEVTETVFLGRTAGYVETALETLSGSGVRIALDDFGTGYASLSHLQQFPIDLLKIDRSFVARIGEDKEAEAIADAVINLARCLAMEVVAEGVESPAQESFLARHGCHTAQGYLYSRPMPAVDVPEAVLGGPKGTAR
ncbi:EAL domain-containing protein [Altererythrobacter soli]|uniref:EAL domain-containing protein n=1 Tax=Croceibacterium soli TaxID=1739690 RepID=A0A6I4UPU8_9SPHN|nr:bifunctional diguanylate cyclase/phosphodiesterase [Croceibacterium soli]MXP40768.1 EAL domain-containing protein [Croceibacterium soli]